MRHHNSYSNMQQRLADSEKVLQPYASEYVKAYNSNKFANASSKNTYVKVLQYVADHDGCKRVDINSDVLGWNKFVKNDGKKRIAKNSRGQHSNMYSQLLYIDVIDYDKNYCYHITEKGRKVLQAAYINDILKFVKGR